MHSLDTSWGKKKDRRRRAATAAVTLRTFHRAGTRRGRLSRGWSRRKFGFGSLFFGAGRSAKFAIVALFWGCLRVCSALRLCFAVCWLLFFVAVEVVLLVDLILFNDAWMGWDGMGWDGMGWGGVGWGGVGWGGVGWMDGLMDGWMD